MHRLLLNREIYTELVQGEIPLARDHIWIVTADIKDMHVEEGGNFIPFLEVLAAMVERGVAVRLIHANTGSLPSASLPRTAARLERAAASAVCTFRLRPCPDVTVKLLLAPPSLASVQRVKCLPEETVRGR